MATFNRKAWNRNKEERSRRFSGKNSEVNYFKPPQGKSYWKLLPPYSESGDPCSEVILYFGYKNAEGKMTVYKGLGTPDCPLMQNYIKVKEHDKKAANFIKPQTKYQYNVVNIKTGEQGVLQVGQKVQDGLDVSLENRLEEDDDFNPFDISNNFVLKITREGKGLQTEYTAGFVKVKDEQINMPDVDVDNLPNLDNILLQLTKEQLQDVVNGNPPVLKKSSEDSDGVAEVPKKTNLKEVKKEEEVDEDLDDDLDDDLNLDDDEEFQKTIAELEDDIE